MEEDFTGRRSFANRSQWVMLLVVMFVCTAVLNPGEEKRLLRKAEEAFALEDYKSAHILYKRAAELMPNSAEVHSKLGLVYVQLNEPKEAKVCFQQAILLNPLVQNKIRLYLGEAHQQDYEFSQARSYYEQEQKKTPALDKAYQHTLRKKIEECIAGEALMKLPAVGTITSVGAGINSEYSDYVPVLMPGNQAMLYTTRRPGKSNQPAAFAGAEQIRISRLEEGVWQASELFLEPQYQMPYHAVVSVAPHGRELYTFFADKGLHVSQKRKAGSGRFRCDCRRLLIAGTGSLLCMLRTMKNSPSSPAIEQEGMVALIFTCVTKRRMATGVRR
ncbi:tetratricopeptide repeat protein [Pontibacter rugosus]